MSNRLYRPSDIHAQEIDNIFVSAPGNDGIYMYYEIYRLVQVGCMPSKISSFRDRIGSIHFIGVLRINIATGEANDNPQMASDQFRRYTRYSADSLRTLSPHDGTHLVRLRGEHHLNEYRELIRRNFLIANGYGLRDDI